MGIARFLGPRIGPTRIQEGQPTTLRLHFSNHAHPERVCWIVNLTVLERISHVSESVLDRVRAHEIPLTGSILDLFFEAADALRSILLRIEKESLEGEVPLALLARLENYASPSQAHETTEIRAPEELPQRPQVLEEPSPLPLELENDGQPILRDEPNAAEETETLASTDQWVRVRADLLDKLMNMMGELVLCRNQLVQTSNRLSDTGLNSGAQRLNLITSELQEHITQTKMQSISTILGRFPRTVRELAKQCGKEIRLQLEGQDTGLERAVLEAIRDPLLHIVRNAIDHGIESPEERLANGKPARGNILIRACHEGGQVSLDISDDGRGINFTEVRELAVQQGLIKENDRLNEWELTRLLFHPGFSTRGSVTKLSGRGVGMDVVRAGIERIGGTVDILSSPSQGTTIKLRIPLTLAIIPALMVKVGIQYYAIPQINLLELVHLNRANLDRVHSTEVYRMRGTLLPIIRLSNLLGLPGDETNANIIVVQAGGRPFGLLVDSECNTEEIVVKPLWKELKKLQIYAGATILGDGQVGLILDVAALARVAGLSSSEGHRQALQAAESNVRQSARTQSLILFRLAGQSETFGLPLSLVSRLEEFPAHQVENSAGHQVVQYRGGLLPLICLAEALGRQPARNEVLSVLVFSNGPRNLGLIVGEILDVVEDVLEIDTSLRDGVGILGTTIVQGKALTLIDLLGLLKKTRLDWFSEKSNEDATAAGQRVLLAHDSEFFRTLARSYLELEGYHVVEASHLDDAVASLSQSEIQAVVVDMGMDGSDKLLLLASGERPTLGLVTRPGSHSQRSQELSGVEILEQFDRDSLVGALRRSREGYSAVQ